MNKYTQISLLNLDLDEGIQTFLAKIYIGVYKYEPKVRKDEDDGFRHYLILFDNNGQMAGADFILGTIIPLIIER